MDDEELGRGNLTAEPGTLSAGGLVGAVKDAPPVAGGGRSAKVLGYYRSSMQIML